MQEPKKKYKNVKGASDLINKQLPAFAKATASDAKNRKRLRGWGEELR